ncbi:MAG: alpha/beta hydrolase [Mogibacterium sp.]|nr:alpha/beta hydrolase [Mogibacterium sp.]
MTMIAKNGQLHLACGDMDYIEFGSGEQPFVMLPGVGDGFKTVKGMAYPFALLYHGLGKMFHVYAFSRREELAPHMTTRDMAADLNEAMEALGIRDAAVAGVSQGGMIAQWLAIDHPERVRKRVRIVTSSRPRQVLLDGISRWLAMADRDDYKGIMLDTAERSYSEKKLRSAKMSYGLLGTVGKPKSYERFRIQAESCVTHDAYEELGRIACPTLVIGGEEDRIATGEASREMAERIPDCTLKMYPGLSHGLYEEVPGFWEEVVGAFCL